MFGFSIISGGLNVLEALTACPVLHCDSFYSSGVIYERSDACCSVLVYTFLQFWNDLCTVWRLLFGACVHILVHKGKSFTCYAKNITHHLTVFPTFQVLKFLFTHCTRQSQILCNSWLFYSTLNFIHFVCYNCTILRTTCLPRALGWCN